MVYIKESILCSFLSDGMISLRTSYHTTMVREYHSTLKYTMELKCMYCSILYGTPGYFEYYDGTIMAFIQKTTSDDIENKKIL